MSARGMRRDPSTYRDSIAAMNRRRRIDAYWSVTVAVIGLVAAMIVSALLTGCLGEGDAAAPPSCAEHRPDDPHTYDRTSGTCVDHLQPILLTIRNGCTGSIVESADRCSRTIDIVCPNYSAHEEDTWGADGASADGTATLTTPTCSGVYAVTVRRAQ